MIFVSFSNYLRNPKSLRYRITNMISKELILILTLMFIWICHGETNDIARIVGGKNVTKADWKDWNFIVAIYKYK